MADVSDLMRRIDDEFAAGEQRVKAYQTEKLQAYEARQCRLESFEHACSR